MHADRVALQIASEVVKICHLTEKLEGSSLFNSLRENQRVHLHEQDSTHLTLSLWGNDALVFVSLCSGPKQNQAGDSKLLSQVHTGGAGAVLPRHACDLLPV